jgi:hypothetical protein
MCTTESFSITGTISEVLTERMGFRLGRRNVKHEKISFLENFNKGNTDCRIG